MTPWKAYRALWLAISFSLAQPMAQAQWVAFNDHAPGTGTHVNTTRYHAFANGYPSSGLLRNISSGTNLTAQLAITRSASGITAANSSANPAGGTPLANVFYGFVDFAGSPDSSIELASGGVLAYTFSNLSTSKLYRLQASVVRGSIDYTNRWTLCEILGAQGFTAAHSSTNVLTTARVAALTASQAALNGGVNHTPETGDYVGWDSIRPAANGTFSLTSRQYTGTVPGGTSNGSKAYGLTGIRLEEFSDEEVAPAIANQPANQSFFEGQTALFTADVTGNPLHYQWFREGAPILDATNRVLSIPCALQTDSANYSFIVSNAAGSVTSSNAFLTIVAPQIIEWGRNEYGQTSVPFTLSNVVMMAAGSWHGLALQRDGTVIGWGRNDRGQITIPADVKNPAAIAAGFFWSMALMPDRTVRCWGDNAWGQCNVPAGLSNVVSIFPGYDHALVLKADGTVAAWGRNNQGQLNIPPGLSNVVQIAASGHYCLVLKGDGTVLAWGNYDGGAAIVVPPNLSNVVAIAAAELHCMALKADGAIVAWGNNSAGQLNVPAGLTNVVAIAGGNAFTISHSVALKDDGTVVAWGANNFNQSTVPLCLQPATQIAASEYYTMVMNAADPTSVGPVLLGSRFIVGVVGRPMHHRFALRNGPGLVHATDLPRGLEMNSAAGLLTGWPRDAGKFVINVSVDTGQAQSDRSYELIIQPNGAAPTIMSDPENQIALSGSNAMLHCAVSNPSPVRLQWYRNGAALAGQTNDTLLFNSVQLADAGTFRLFVESSGGSMWSDPATLTVLESPRFDPSNVRFDSSNQFLRVFLEKLTGYNSIVIESSTNPPDWNAVFTNDSPGSTFEFVTPIGLDDPIRFYRARAKSD